MTNKYHFSGTSTWALSMLCDITQCTRPLPPGFHAFYYANAWCTVPNLSRMIEVATLCGHQQLCDHATEIWINLLWHDWEHPQEAIDVADQYSIARLQGVSYYLTLLQCEDDLSYPSFERRSEGEDTSVFTPAQRAQLLSGSFLLVKRWDQIRTSVPTFTRSEGCTYHAHGCFSTWRTVWKATMSDDRIGRLPTVDLLRRMLAARELLEANHELRSALTPLCRSAAIDSVKDLYRREEEQLATYFRDLTSEATHVGPRTLTAPD